jgi:hypothetical protein
VLSKLKQEPKHEHILGLKKQDPPVGSFKFKHIGLLLVVGGLGCQGVVHTHGIFQVLFGQGLFWLIFILQMDTRKTNDIFIGQISILFLKPKTQGKKSLKKSMKVQRKSKMNGE